MKIADVPSPHLSARALGLTALDRVQVMNHGALRDQRAEMRRWNRFSDLPWYFFQCALPDGRLEIAASTGYVDHVWPEEIVDIRKSEPVQVLAMTHAAFMARLRAHPRPQPTPEDYAPAHVMRVQKDRWGRIDRVHVAFLDPQHAIDRGHVLTVPPIADECRRQLASVATRRRMPVIALTRSAARSASGETAGLATEARTADTLVRRFFTCALRGHTAGQQALSEHELKPVTTAKLNKLGAPLPAIR